MTSLPHPNLTVITGASRGMGLAMAQQLLQPGDTLLCISRTTQMALTQQATATGTTLLQWTHDLADGASLSTRLEAWLRQITRPTWGSASLINNAGMIPRIGPLSASEPLDLAHALDLIVIAEGVETSEQLAVLRRLGCDQAVGFHFSRPAAPEALTELILA